MSVREEYDGFINNIFGVVTGSSSAIQFASTIVGLIRFKTDLNNNGIFFLGSDPGNCIYPLDAGEDTGWVSLSSLGQLYHRNPSGSSDYLYYWLQN